MKLLCCLECNNIFNLKVGVVKTCECGNVSGHYVDNLNAEFTAKSYKYCLLGFANDSLVPAIEYVTYYREENMSLDRGTEFCSFVIPEPCKTFKKVDKLDE